jgi:hypothetical protein
MMCMQSKQLEELLNRIEQLGTDRAEGRAAAANAMGEMVPLIREALKAGYAPAVLAHRSKLSRETIYQIRGEEG